MGFIGRPQLIDGIVFHAPEDESFHDVIVITGAEPLIISRDIFEKVVPLLTGQRTLAELAAELKDVVAATTFVAAVQRLAKHRAVFDAATSSPNEDEKAAVGRVSLYCIGDARPDELPHALSGTGFSVAAEGEQSDFTIVVTDHYLRDELATLNATMRSPWLLVRPSGLEMLVGPLIVPDETACWECMEHRVRLNSKIEQFAARETGTLPVPVTSVTRQSGAARAIAYAFAAQQARDWVSGRRLVPPAMIRAIDPAALTVTAHHVVRRPQCPVCGTKEFTPVEPIILPAAPPFAAPLRDSDVTARATLDRYGHHVSPLTGLLPELIDRSKAPGIHVYSGGPYTARAPKDWRSLTNALEYRASGKGLTQAAAKASALAETLEWYTLDAQDQRALEIDSFDRLSTRARAIPPPALTHFSERQYANRDSINERYAESKYRVPERFDPSTPFGWLKIWSLSNQEWAFVPGAACASSYRCPFVKPSSNGNAAGATREDAILHGVLEAIERDAIALWWYNGASRPAVALDGVDTALLAAMDLHYRRADRRYWVLNITTDLGVPAMAAVSVVDGQTQGEPIMGFGAHFDPVVAATRALTELNQLQPRLADIVPREDRRDHATDTNGPLPSHIHASEALPRTRLSDWTRPPALHPGDAVRDMIDRLRGIGLELLVADLTLPDVGLPVVKALIPGLRHAYPELGPGRLHDVPLALGWIDAPVPEDRMSALFSPL